MPCSATPTFPISPWPRPWRLRSGSVRQRLFSRISAIGSACITMSEHGYPAAFRCLMMVRDSPFCDHSSHLLKLFITTRVIVGKLFHITSIFYGKFALYHCGNSGGHLGDKLFWRLLHRRDYPRLIGNRDNRDFIARHPKRSLKHL